MKLNNTQFDILTYAVFITCACGFSFGLHNHHPYLCVVLFTTAVFWLLMWIRRDIDNNNF